MGPFQVIEGGALGLRNTTPDAEILWRMERGEYRDALRLLAAAHGDVVHSHCVRMVGSERARDVLQQTFLQAQQALPTYRREAPLRAWLLGIAHHRCLDALKKDKRQRSHVVPEDELPEPVALLRDVDEVIDEGRANLALETCVAALPPHIRAAVLLHYAQGLSFQQLGPILGSKPNTLQARVARAFPLLRRCLLAKGVRR
jgi:RNA polymerase sigma-70 factor (ECF subfamily)